MKRIIITNKEHPRFDEIGTVIIENMDMSPTFLGIRDMIRNERGEQYYAKKSDYKLIFQRHR